MKNFDIAIIGGGVVGALIARKLSKYDCSIALLEKCQDVAMGASKANSGIVHAGHDALPGTLKAKFNVLGNAMYADMCSKLGVKYKNIGALVVAYSKQQHECIEALYSRGQANGVPNLSVIERDEVLEIVPNISHDVYSALYAKTSAITCPYELTIAAVGNAMDNGAELFLNFAVNNIVKKGQNFVINNSIASKYIINCAGLFADEIANLIGDDSFSLHARRGEYLLLDKSEGGFLGKTIFNVPTKMGKGILLSPTVDGNLLIGPTSVDIDDKTDSSTTTKGIAKIIALAKAQFENIQLKNVITSFTGLRASSSSDDFIVSSSKVDKRFINVAGIDSPGLTAAPAIAEYVFNILRDIGYSPKKKNNVIEKRVPDSFFQDMSAEEKNILIKKQAAFGKIICRCESITEGEIIHALNNNPKATDIDGIKRRTRSGMGRCQGGFCSPQIAHIIARETGKDVLEVTKFGGNSYINISRTK